MSTNYTGIFGKNDITVIFSNSDLTLDAEGGKTR